VTDFKLNGQGNLFVAHKGARKAKKIEAKLTLGDLNIEQFNEKCPTFKEYAEMCLSLPNDRRRSTSYFYKTNLKNHVYPAIGNMRLDHIQRKDLKWMFDRLLTQGIQSKTFMSIKATINAILSHGIDSQLIEVNPMRDLKFKHKTT